MPMSLSTNDPVIPVSRKITRPLECAHDPKNVRTVLNIPPRGPILIQPVLRLPAERNKDQAVPQHEAEPSTDSRTFFPRKFTA